MDLTFEAFHYNFDENGKLRNEINGAGAVKRKKLLLLLKDQISDTTSLFRISMGWSVALQCSRRLRQRPHSKAHERRVPSSRRMAAY